LLQIEHRVRNSRFSLTSRATTSSDESFLLSDAHVLIHDESKKSLHDFQKNSRKSIELLIQNPDFSKPKKYVSKHPNQKNL